MLQRDHYDPAADVEFPPPNLGRSVHVVDTVVNVHPDETPHVAQRHVALDVRRIDPAHDNVPQPRRRERLRRDARAG